MIRPDHLNLQHLRYYWAVVQEGGVTGAARRLHLTQPTVSAQLRKLERALGGRLLRREGRKVVPTELGRTVFDYADRIFALGQDLVDAVRQQSAHLPARFTVGATDVLPKLAIRSLLADFFTRDGPEVQLILREGKPEQLLADLAVHRLDLVISDRKVPLGSAVRAYDHDLGGSPVGFYARPAVAERLRDGFPGSLDDHPTFLPTEGTALRSQLEDWFERVGIRPRVVAEFEDSALMKVCAEGRDCAYPGEVALEGALQHHFGAARIGVVPEIEERYYAISLERRVLHPAVQHVLRASPFLPGPTAVERRPG